MRVVMQLADGDDVSFAMPDHRRSLYRFARYGTEVTASDDVDQQMAEIESLKSKRQGRVLPS